MPRRSFTSHRRFEIIYGLAFTPVEHVNLFQPTKIVYTKEAAPLFYVHPDIAADLSPRLYCDNFSAVLPIQKPSEFTRG